MHVTRRYELTRELKRQPRKIPELRRRSLQAPPRPPPSDTALLPTPSPGLPQATGRQASPLLGDLRTVGGHLRRLLGVAALFQTCRGDGECGCKQSSKPNAAGETARSVLPYLPGADPMDCKCLLGLRCLTRLPHYCSSIPEITGWWGTLLLRCLSVQTHHLLASAALPTMAVAFTASHLSLASTHLASKRSTIAITAQAQATAPAPAPPPERPLLDSAW
jgi:hypothetical protein